MIVLCKISETLIKKKKKAFHVLNVVSKPRLRPVRLIFQLSVTQLLSSVTVLVWRLCLRTEIIDIQCWSARLVVRSSAFTYSHRVLLTSTLGTLVSYKNVL